MLGPAVVMEILLGWILISRRFYYSKNVTRKKYQKKELTNNKSRQQLGKVGK